MKMFHMVKDTDWTQNFAKEDISRKSNRIVFLDCDTLSHKALSVS